PIALRITGDNLPEGIRIVSGFGAAAAGTAAALQEIRIDGAPLLGFSPACREYHLAAAPERVSATAVVHGAATVLPPAGGKQVIAVLSVDGKAFARYTLCFDHGEPCFGARQSAWPRKKELTKIPGFGIMTKLLCKSVVIGRQARLRCV